MFSLNLGLRSRCDLARSTSGFALTVGLVPFNALYIWWNSSGSSVVFLPRACDIHPLFTAKCRLQKTLWLLGHQRLPSHGWTFLTWSGWDLRSSCSVRIVRVLFLSNLNKIIFWLLFPNLSYTVTQLTPSPPPCFPCRRPHVDLWHPQVVDLCL